MLTKGLNTTYVFILYEAVISKMAKVVKTRKEHICASCGEYIKKGEEAKVVSVKWGRVSGDGSYWESNYYHKNCEITERNLYSR